MFWEQGIPVTAIFTATGMIITTIVVSLTGESGGAALPKDKNKLVEWFKDKLKDLSNALSVQQGRL